MTLSHYDGFELAWLLALDLWELMDSEIGINWGGLAHQIQERLQSGAVGV
ncbi:MAG: hypothetical protein VKP70_00280 [Cyanobacteriota bacterium]|nr:hypothetical protein [Cyanobacteriota bacterium]